MLHTRLASNFCVSTKRFARCCLVAFLCLFIGNAWATPTQHVKHDSFISPAASATTSITASQLGAGAANTTQNQTHVITNNGTMPETFNLTVVSRQSWTVVVTPTQVLIVP